MLQQVTVFDSQVAFLGVCLTRDRIPMQMKQYVWHDPKNHVPCFLITKESIEIKSKKGLVVKGLSQDTIQITHRSFPETLTIVGRNGKGYALISLCDKQRRSSDLVVVPQATINGIFSYFCRVTDEPEEDHYQENNDFLDDDDFEMMFSSKTSPFVGSFVDTFFDNVPLIA